MAFPDAFDMSLVIKYDLKMGQFVPIPIFIDSPSLFDVLTRAKVAIERRLMINLKPLKHLKIRKKLIKFPLHVPNTTYLKHLQD